MGQTTNDFVSQADRLADQGNWFKAAPLYARAETQFRLAGDHRNELYAKLGRLHGDAEEGSYRTTRTEVVRDLADPIVEHDPQLKIRALALLGTIDLNLNTAAAQEDYKQLLSVAASAEDKKWQNRAKGELGLVAGVNGDIGAAGVALFQAITTAEAIGDIPGEVHFATWLANGMAVHGMADRALQLLDHATELARRNGYAEMPLQLSIAKVRAMLLLPEPRRLQARGDGKRLLEDTLQEAEKNGVMGAQTELLALEGQVFMEERDYQDAEKAFDRVASISKAASLPREEGEALLRLSQLYRALDQPAKAAAAIDEGIEVLQRVEEAYDLPVFIAEKAEVQAARGSLSEADALYSQASDLIDGLLVNAQSSRVKTEMISAMSDIYVGHFRLAWNRLHSAAEAFRIVESVRGRALLDSMRYARQTGPMVQESLGERTIARLQNTLIHGHLRPSETRRILYQLDYAYFRLSPVEYVRSRKEMELLRRPPVELAALRRQLEPNESLVEFLLDAKASYALVVTQAGLTVRQLPGRAEINQLVRRFLSAIQNKQDTTASAKALYQTVLAPVAGRGRSALIVVPDGSLHLVPFGALVDESGTLMGRQMAVAAVPSATIYVTLRAAGQRPAASQPFLGVAYSPPATTPSQPLASTRGVFDISGANLRPLQYGREEITEAARSMGPGSVLLYGDRASEAALKAEPLRDFRVLHFAAHGVGNESEPDRAGLVLEPGSKEEDGLWQSREIRETRLNADVVVLSACETGSGRLEGEEGIMDLARSFLIAGAKSVLASLWAVDDRSTATLMGFFYEHLAAGLEVREALRQAQLDFIRDYGSKAEPYYWAGFEVIGDGTRRIVLKTSKPDLGPAKANIR